LAEKLVGYLGREVVSLDHQIKHIAGYTMRWSQIGCHHKRGLQSEADLQAALKRAYDGIKQVNAMTLGLDDWIMATANAHEENEYLLQQALTPVPGRQASGAPTAEGDFYDNPEKKEVLEFANTGAISNSPEVAAAAAADGELDVSGAEAVAEADEAPPTPTEIKDEAGGSAVSTLNRFVVKTEDPAVEPAVKMNRDRMAAWLRELNDSEIRHGSRSASAHSTPHIRLKGFSRDVRPRDLKAYGVRTPYSGRSGYPPLQTTPAFDTPDEAYRAAEAMAKQYRKENWPGGMATVVALAEFPDQPNEDNSGGIWVGVVNTYYSFS